MAALDFPPSPTVGDKYPVSPVAGQPQYTWDGEKWTTTGAQVTSAGPSNNLPLMDATPAVPGVGTQYAREDHVHPTDTSRAADTVVLKRSPQTLTVTEQTDVRKNVYAAPFDALAYSGMQVNGSMEVSQERGLAGTVPANFHVVDGWYLASSGPGVVLGAQYSSSPSFGIPIIPYCIGITVTTAQASLGASDYYILYQKIEGTRVSRLAWGTASAQPITIGFWTAHHRPGLYSGSVRNDAPNRSYVFTYTQAVADVAQYNVITIPGDVAGAWKIDNTVGLWLTFCIAVGSSNLVTPNVWGAGGAGATGQVNAVAATSDIFRITGVVVLPGIEAPSAARSPLIMRPYDQELATCQRYFQLSGATTGIFYSATNIQFAMAYTMMRTTTTVTLRASTNAVNRPGVAAYNITALNTVNLQNNGGFVDVTTNAAVVPPITAQLISQAFGFDARL